MVPPWTPPPPQGDDAPPPEPPNGDPPPPEPPNGDALSPPEPPLPLPSPSATPVAPKARFGSARHALGDYARSGDRTSLQRSAGHYVRKGYGGASTAVRRFGGTSATAAALASYLSGGSGAAVEGERAVGASASAREIVQSIIEAVRPIDGSLDAEASRAAMADAFADLLNQFPDADLRNLDEDQRAFVVEHFTAMDVCQRFMLDMGKTITEKAPSASTAAARIKEVRGFIQESVAASFRKRRDAGRTVTSGSVARLVRDALRATFVVFEEYAV
jgi:hypothetical protein